MNFTFLSFSIFKPSRINSNVPFPKTMNLDAYKHIQEAVLFSLCSIALSPNPYPVLRIPFKVPYYFSNPMLSSDTITFLILSSKVCFLHSIGFFSIFCLMMLTSDLMSRFFLFLDTWCLLLLCRDLLFYLL